MLARPQRGPHFAVRSYAPADFDALHRLDLQCFPPEIAYARDELRYFLSAKDSLAWVAEAGNVLGGFLIAQIYRGRATFQARLITIDVAPEQRRHHVGTLLMETFHAAMRARHVARIRLEVGVNNAAAQQFYLRFGYDRTGTLSGYYATGEDAFSMTLTL
jgi:ribosomal-protein-alanine N-acetyltransferase